MVHTQGWPLSETGSQGGSFMYHFGDNLVAIGLVVHLSYENPYLSPFDEFQRFKTHPDVAKYLKGGKRLVYGSRAINEGGVQSVPKLTFPGGALIGCSAGFVNVPRIKGSHNAIKSGMLGAEAAFEALAAGKTGGDELTAYPAALKASWLWKDLDKVRNVKPALQVGLGAGHDLRRLRHVVPRPRHPPALDLHHKKADHETLRPAAEFQPIQYPKPDGVVSFDKLSSVFLSNTNHEEDQPVHLKLRDPSIPIAVNLPLYAEPAQRYCPAGVYEVVDLRQRPAALSDQRAELRALQDLRYQGSGAEHRLDGAGGRRRAQLPEHVTGMRPISFALLSAALVLPLLSPVTPSRAAAAQQPRVSGRQVASISLSGRYLAGRVAEQDHDYENGADQLDLALAQAPGDLELLYSTFRLRTYAGRIDAAAQLAPQVLAVRPGDGIANLVWPSSRSRAATTAPPSSSSAASAAENQLGPLREFVVGLAARRAEGFRRLRAPRSPS